MTALLWDQVGDRFYETGVDRAVLYLPSGLGVSWNGLISVNDKSTGTDGAPIYYDGIKYADHVAAGEFSGSIKAYTYPEEFLQFEGVLDAGNGLYVTNQPVARFGLSYRTKIGNDVDGVDLGYKLHVLYNLIATPSQKSYETLTEGNVSEFEWTISAIPDEIPGFRPTAHLIFDTRQTSPLLLADIERTLYGTEFDDARLPSISTLVSFIGNWVIVRITDNGDGTWTITAPDDLLTMTDSTTFQLIQANAVYLDVDTYMVSDSTY